MVRIARRTRPGTHGRARRGAHGGGLTALLALLCAGLAACSGEPEPPAPAKASPAPPKPATPVAPAAQPSAPSRPLAEAVLNASAYPSELAPGGSAKLAAGIYRAGEEGGGELVIRMHRIAWGDLDGDGDEDAAVVIAEEPGKDRVWYTLHAVLNEDGKPKNAANTRLGSAHVNRVDVVDGVVVAKLATPDEATEVRYELVDGKLAPTDGG